MVPIRELLSEPGLVLDQWFHLDGASPESQVLLRAELKVKQVFRHINLSLCVSNISVFYFAKTFFCAVRVISIFKVFSLSVSIWLLPCVTVCSMSLCFLPLSQHFGDS